MVNDPEWVDIDREFVPAKPGTDLIGKAGTQAKSFGIVVYLPIGRRRIDLGAKFHDFFPVMPLAANRSMANTIPNPSTTMTIASTT